MIHNSEPSQLFLDSIHTAFHLAQGQGEITPSAIWDHVVGICLRRTHTFAEMFVWDVHCKPHSRRNRIADIAEAICKGYVPQLRLARNARGGLIVLHGGEEGQ